MNTNDINHFAAPVHQLRVELALSARKRHYLSIRFIQQEHLFPGKEFSNKLLHIVRMKMHAFPIIPLKQYIGTVSHVTRISQHTQIIMYSNLHAAIFHLNGILIRK